MGETFSTHRREEKYRQYFGGETWKKKVILRRNLTEIVSEGVKWINLA